MFIGSEDDCFIPVAEMREIRDKLELSEKDYIEYPKELEKSHFMDYYFPELLKIAEARISADMKNEKN